MECFSVIIDLQMKGIYFKNDQETNIPQPYQLNDIGKMLPVFKEMLMLVDSFVQMKLSSVASLEHSGATEWNWELQVSNCRVHYIYFEDFSSGASAYICKFTCCKFLTDNLLRTQ